MAALCCGALNVIARFRRERETHAHTGVALTDWGMIIIAAAAVLLFLLTIWLLGRE